MDNVTQSVLDTVRLPSLPELVRDLQQLIDRNEHLDIISDLLATDTALVARVIELANSAYYGRHKVNRIFEAVQLIGLNRISLFVRTAYTIDLLKSRDGKTIDLSVFWTRSFVSALISQHIAERIHFPRSDTLYTAGVLMYIGELIEALLPEHSGMENLCVEHLAAEQMIRWGFPEILSEAIRHYRRPSGASDQFALPASILHLTDCIVLNELDRLDADALQVTRLDMNEILAVTRDFAQLELSGENYATGKISDRSDHRT